MKFAEAGIADVLRSVQRDEIFVKEKQDDIQSFIKLFGSKNYAASQRIIPTLTNAWYYCMTTMGNLQTLGEEYTGTLRFSSDQNKIPSRSVELIWLLFYIGGEPLYDRLVQSLQNKVEENKDLTEKAQSFFLKILELLQTQKQTLKRIHHSLFYINGKYYNISNRIMGIKYALVREWMRDDTFTQSFILLGYISLFYILFNLVQQIWSSKNNGNVVDNVVVGEVSRKCCVLCSEIRKNPCVTPCGHIFCWDCIANSLTFQQTCPMCREVVLPSRIILLQNYT